MPPYGGSVSTPDGYLLALWQHECQRVFADKMISLEDKAWISSAISEVSKYALQPPSHQDNFP